MFRLFMISLLLGAMIAAAGAPSYAIKLLSPTRDQVVRENVKITIPVSDLPADFVIPKDEITPEGKRPFIALLVGSGGADRLVAALGSDMGSAKDGMVTFLWDSKAPYHDPQDQKNERFFKDGRYTLTVQVYDGQGKVADTAAVDVELKNKVARINGAPPVSLVNRLVFGESHLYGIHADVQVFHMVNNTALPVLGGMGMTSEFKIIQSVEDKRPDGSYLMRCRMAPEAFVSSFGQRMRLFQSGQPTPQLYRLVDKFGNVLTRNVFSRQAKYTMMDVLPVLPSRSVREGESWPTTFDLKIEGITSVIPFTGTSQLDSFEWQNGHECAKIISGLDGSSVISMDNGRVRSSSAKVHADVITYFAYRSGKMLRREITLEFPAVIMPGAGQLEGAGGGSPGAAPPAMQSPYGSDSGPEDMLAPPPRSMGGPSGAAYPGATTAGSSTSEPASKQGSVQVKVVVGLEK